MRDRKASLRVFRLCFSNPFTVANVCCFMVFPFLKRFIPILSQYDKRDNYASDLQGFLNAIEENSHETWLASRKRRAEIISERASAARLQVNPTAYRKAADFFGEAARLVATDDVHKAREYQFQQALVLGNLGREFGDNDALREAIALYQQILSGIDRAADPLDWATTQNNLGNALSTLGEQESDKKLLNEAVAAYRAALEEFTHERVPLDWAMTQNNLGNALRVLGERESGTKLLEEAVAAHRAALQERTRERVPLDWATTQNNLGLALQTLGERESGTAQLEEAVAAYRAALEEITRERVPLHWVGTQNDLGNALSALGVASRTIRFNFHAGRCFLRVKCYGK
jgi:tetratricopeptide (TPR) repeat protein